MTPVKRFRFRNTMLIANIIANLVGVTVVSYLSRRAGMTGSAPQSSVYADLNHVFLPLSFAIPIAVTLIYERPIRRYLKLRNGSLSTSSALIQEAQRRLLNEPIFLIILNALVWLSAAITYSLYFSTLGMGNEIILDTASRSLQVGIVSVTVAFFVTEFFLQRRLAPYFFPEGGLTAVKGTIRIRIRTRLVAFLAATNLIPLSTLARGSWTVTHSMSDPGHALSTVHTMILGDAVIFIGVGLWLTFLISSNLSRQLAAITAALQRIQGGHFEQRVRVTSNDELGYVGDTVNEMAKGLEEREFIKEIFGKYVSREVRDEVLSRRIPLNGEVRDVSVLFADLRNFTPLVERTTPQQVVRIINRYFEEMETAIRAHGGFVLQFIGDEIEAVFGAPLPLDDHATKAMIAAVDMNHGLKSVNHILADEGHPLLQHGIGIHTGTVVAANIGSASRLSYAMVGDTVNLASRLQDANKQHGTSIIVSAETHRRLSKEFPLRHLPLTALKGKSESMALYGL
jgi:adenylate cyclase